MRTIGIPRDVEDPLPYLALLMELGRNCRLPRRKFQMSGTAQGSKSLGPGNDCERSEHLSAKGWEARTNIYKQAGTFWWGEIASLRACEPQNRCFWGLEAPGLGESL